MATWVAWFGARSKNPLEISTSALPEIAAAALVGVNW
jgi:hypothetical protein